MKLSTKLFSMALIIGGAWVACFMFSDKVQGISVVIPATMMVGLMVAGITISVEHEQ